MPQDTTPERASAAVLVAVALLSAAVLALEVTLTRILSVLTWHHFVFLILGTALLGFGAAGTTLTLAGSRQTGLATWRNISKVAWLFAGASVVAVYLLVRMRPEPLWIATRWIELPKLATAELLVATPFYFAGLVLGQLIDRYRADVGRLYAADLAGGGLGSLASTVAIERLGAVNALAVIAALGAAAGWLLLDRPGRWRIACAPALPAALALILGALAPRDMFFVPPSPTKELDGVLIYGPPEELLEVSRWHPIARVDIAPDADVVLRGFGGSLDPTLHLRWREHLVFQDGSAPTGIPRCDGQVASLPFLGSYLQASPYVTKHAPRVLVIGMGGGIDVLIALFHGATHVTGVEINPWILDAVEHRYRDYVGGLLAGPNVQLVLDEGRHFAAADRSTPYDVIQLSGVDTFTALASGAYALAESYLYTREAIEALWQRLAPGGILSYSRHFMQPPRETLRLAATMAEAMERQGVADPARHVFITSAPGWADTEVCKSAFTSQELSALREWAALHHFDVVYDPERERPRSPYDAMLRGTALDRATIYDLYFHDVRPALDDRPFFFDYYKWRNLFHLDPGRGGYPSTRLPFGLMTLLASLAVGGALAAWLILLPLRRLGRDTLGGQGYGAMLAYFAALGAGYIAVEIVAIQQMMVYLSGPAYATAITLSAMLVSSGLGSLASTSLGLAESTTRRRWLAGGVVASILLLDPTVTALVRATEGSAFTARALLAALAVAPMAFLIGMPFPVGVRRISGHAPGWVPWAWGANAFATVVGSPGSVLVAMTLGFSATLRLAALTYALGFLALERLDRAGEPDPPRPV